MKQIAILGCGPAGLTAAHAAITANLGHVFIFSKRRQSEMFGAQYLHAPIPDIVPGDPITVHYRLRGSVTDYRMKVYGPGYAGDVSPGVLPELHQAWDIRRTYDTLWALYNSWITPAIIDNEWLLVNAGRFDAIISTVPAPVLCHNGHHRFYSQDIYAIGDAPSRGRLVSDVLPLLNVPEGTVICNGRPQPRWYRASRIFGHTTVEWSTAGSDIPAPKTSAVVRKPITNTCTCWPGVNRVGRYGRWEKGFLVHQAYQETMRCLINL